MKRDWPRWVASLTPVVLSLIVLDLVARFGHPFPALYGLPLLAIAGAGFLGGWGPTVLAAGLAEAHLWGVEWTDSPSGPGSLNDTIGWAAAYLLSAGLGTLLHVRKETGRRPVDEAPASSGTHIQDYSPQAILVIDTNGKVKRCNFAAESIFGWTAERIAAGVDFFSCFPPHHKLTLMNMIRGCADSAEWPPFGKKIEISALRKSGREFPVEMSINRARLGESVALSIFLMDLTDLKQSEAATLRAQRMEALGRMAGRMAHDFNNVLTCILGFGEVLNSSSRDFDASQKDAIREILAAGHRASALIRQLLAFSRKQVMSPKVIDLNELIGEVKGLLKRALGEDVHLETHLDPDLGSVRVDPGQIEQVLLNLVLNARDAMPQGGRLTIRTSNTELTKAKAAKFEHARPGSYVRIEVKDTGFGMDDETQRRVFEPFFTRGKEGRGTGLGLASAYGIVRQSDGFMTVWSVPGQGASFTAHFPRADVAPERIRRKEGVAAPSGGTETILVAEDSDVVRKLAVTTLRGAGYHVLEAQDGQEGQLVSARHAGPIQLLISDIVMPKCSGTSLAMQLLEQRPGIKLMFMSGYADTTALSAPILASGPSFLQKPFVPQELLKRTRKILDDSADDSAVRGIPSPRQAARRARSER